MIHCAVLTAASLLTPAAVELDFSTATTGQEYEFDLVIKDPAGNVLVSGPIGIGDKATAKDVRDAVSDFLGASGLEVVADGDHTLRIASKGDKRLGAVTYDTFVKGEQAPLSGPRLTARAGGASLTVNGAAGQPPPPKK